MNMDNSTAPACTVSADSLKDLKLFGFAISIIVSLFGLVCNTLVIIANKRYVRRTSTDVYVVFLAIADNLVIIALSFNGYRYAYHLLHPTRFVWHDVAIVSFIGIMFSYWIRFINTYTIVALNIDRFIQVTWPGYAAKSCTPRRAKFVILAVIIASTLFCAPRLGEYIPLIQNVEISAKGCRGYFFIPTHGLITIDEYKLVYQFILYIIVMYAIPLVVLITTNQKLIRTIIKSRKYIRDAEAERKDGEWKKTRKDLSIIVSLVIVTLTFMLLQIPDVVVQVLWRTNRDIAPTGYAVSIFLLLVNSSVNFIIYTSSSRVYRKRISKFFRSCRGLPDNARVGDEGETVRETNVSKWSDDD